MLSPGTADRRPRRPRDPGQHHQHREDRRGEDEEDRAPRHHPEQHLGDRRPDELPGRARRRRDPEGQRPPLRRGRPPDDGEDDAEARPGDAEADQHVQHLVRARRHREGRERQAEGIEERADDDRLLVAVALGDRAEDRLADAPGEVLDGDGEAELRPRPAELLGDRDLEDAEGRADGEADHQDQAARDEHGSDERGLGFGHGGDLAGIGDRDSGSRPATVKAISVRSGITECDGSARRSRRAAALTALTRRGLPSQDAGGGP